jgi:vacuolar-type H+-ATPase subunit I/STV1
VWLGHKYFDKNILKTKGKIIMITLVIVGVVALAGGFVFGVLFERRNTKKVEAAIAVIKAEALKAGVKL